MERPCRAGTSGLNLPLLHRTGHTHWQERGKRRRQQQEDEESEVNFAAAIVNYCYVKITVETEEETT